MLHGEVGLVDGESVNGGKQSEKVFDMKQKWTTARPHIHIFSKLLSITKFSANPKYEIRLQSLAVSFSFFYWRVPWKIKLYEEKNRGKCESYGLTRGIALLSFAPLA